MRPTRRAVCGWLAAAACAPPDDGGWSVDLADYPALGAVGGSARVDLDDAYLHVVVARVGEDDFVAVWAICTHGACEVAYEADAREVVCPCHGSRFGEDGAVHEGPATRPLRRFEVVRDGDRLWIA